MRSALAVLLALTVPAAAAAQDDPLRSLARGVGELRSDAGQSYARLRLLEQSLLGRDDGARITIRQRSAVDPFFRLVGVSYAIDGQPMVVDRGDALREPLEIYDGVLAPGEHTLSVVLRYRGEGHGVVGYLPGYRFVVRSSCRIVVPNRGRLDVVVRPYTRDPTVPYTERLQIEYEARERPRDE